jgi:hypothetical protein
MARRTASESNRLSLGLRNWLIHCSTIIRVWASIIGGKTTRDGGSNAYTIRVEVATKSSDANEISDELTAIRSAESWINILLIIWEVTRRGGISKGGTDGWRRGRKTTAVIKMSMKSSGATTKDSTTMGPTDAPENGGVIAPEEGNPPKACSATWIHAALGYPDSENFLHQLRMPVS